MTFLKILRDGMSPLSCRFANRSISNVFCFRAAFLFSSIISVLTHSFLQGSFLPPKIIILIKCLIDILFFKVLF